VSRIDLHVHTEASPDGRCSLKEFDRAAVKVGLRGFAVTDHNTTAAVKHIRDCRTLVIPGIEVSCHEGHVVVLGVSTDLPRMSVSELVERASELGGLVIAVHPYRAVTGIGEEAVVSNDFDALEAVNARTWDAKNRKALALARRLRMPATGGSDAHTLEELGAGYTEVEGDSVDDVLENIRKGRCTPGGHGRSSGEALRGAVKNAVEWLKRWGRI